MNHLYFKNYNHKLIYGYNVEYVQSFNSEKVEICVYEKSINLYSKVLLAITSLTGQRGIFTPKTLILRH
jgi:hypothetical protein